MAREQSSMPANLYEYDVMTVGPEIAEIRKALSERGRRGFTISHTRVDEQGVYTFILTKNTGMQAEDDSMEWVDDGFVNDETSWT